MIDLAPYAPSPDVAQRLALAASARLLAALGLPPAPAADLARWQAQAQEIGWRSQFPDAVWHLITRDDGVVLGRLIVDPTRDGVRVVDLVLLPEGQRAQAGIEVIRQLQAHGLPLLGTVLADNPALHVFRHLGLQVVREAPPYVEVRWDPPAA